LETAPADPVRGTPRYRLERAGIRNVWQYDDQIFDFAEGRLLLRGRNGAGKSKALEILLPFLLDGDARRLDTTGTSRTRLRWLRVDATRSGGPAADAERSGPNLRGEMQEEHQAADDDAETGPLSRLGYLWVECTTERGARGLDAAARTTTASALLAAGAAEDQ